MKKLLLLCLLCGCGSDEPPSGKIVFHGSTQYAEATLTLSPLNDSLFHGILEIFTSPVDSVYTVARFAKITPSYSCATVSGKR